jgi:hypothetical protein
VFPRAIRLRALSAWLVDALINRHAARIVRTRR